MFAWLARVWKWLKDASSASSIWDWLKWAFGVVIGIGGAIWGFIVDMGPWVLLIAFGAPAMAVFLWNQLTLRHFAIGGAPKISADKPTHEQFQQRLLVFRAELDDRFLNEPDPYLLFTFWLFNGSAVPVSVRSVKGQVKLTDRLLTGRVDLRDAPDIASGDKHHFTLFQEVSPQTVQRINQMLSVGSRCEFLFDSLFVNVASHEVPGVERRLDLPSISSRSRKWHMEWQS